MYENANETNSGASPTPPHYVHPSHGHSTPSPASPARQPTADTKKVHFNLAGTQGHGSPADERVFEARNEEVGADPELPPPSVPLACPIFT